MTSLNKHIIIGRVGKEPVIRKTQSGKSVCELSIATTDNKITEWHKVVTWDKTADFCGANIQKGSMIYVEGPCEMKKSTSADGRVFFSKETVGHRVVPLSSFGKKQEEVVAQEQSTSASEEYDAQSDVQSGQTIDDEDLPF